MDIRCQSSLTLTSNHIHSALEDVNVPSSLLYYTFDTSNLYFMLTVDLLRMKMGEIPSAYKKAPETSPVTLTLGPFLHPVCPLESSYSSYIVRESQYL